MNLPETFPERPTIIEFKNFSFGEYFDKTNQEEKKDIERLAATELFSLFTADIIKQEVIFTR